VHVRRRYGNLEISEQIPRRNVMGGIAIVALLTGLWLSDLKFGGDLALSGLTWLHRAPWRIADPLFHRDLSFYVFAWPFYFQIVDYLLLICFWSLLLCILGYALVGSIRWRSNRLQIDDRPRVHIAVLVALAIALLGVRYWLSRYGVLFQGTGFDDGVGYTDVHARLPAQRALAVLSFAVSHLGRARRGGGLAGCGCNCARLPISRRDSETARGARSAPSRAQLHPLEHGVHTARFRTRLD
jgi:uncharacterized protein